MSAEHSHEAMRPTVVTIFGASGDLAVHKLLPALYQLFVQGKVRNVLLICVSDRLDAPADFLEQVLRPALVVKDEAVWREFTKSMRFCSFNLREQNEYVCLTQIFAEYEKTGGKQCNRLFYCATPPSLYGHITKSLATARLLNRQTSATQPWHRIAYEKPFGTSAASAQELLALIEQYLVREQFFLVDHFIAKAFVENIVFVRFANMIFQALWCAPCIKQVEIRLLESGGVGERGYFYDAVGAIVDVVQNHLLQLLALVAMEPPGALTEQELTRAKHALLKSVCYQSGILGQYAGYQKLRGVAPQSRTETFAALLFSVDTERWSGVPFLITTGKCLERKEVNIIITLHNSVHPLFSQMPSVIPNQIILGIDPKLGLTVRVNLRDPKVTDEVASVKTVPVELDFCYNCTWLDYQDEYAAIFTQLLKSGHSTSGHSKGNHPDGDHLFVDPQLMCDSWCIVDTIPRAQLPLYEYAQGSAGPQELKNFLRDHGLE